MVISQEQPITGEYDIIFAGGGTAACVCAGRLAAADPSLRILVLEAGPHTRDLPDHVQPARYFRNLTSPQALSFQVGRESKALNGRKPIIPVGKCVGGGSAVNFQMYTRASASDYDDWEKFGNPGWGSKELIPLANKAETYQVNDSSKHGHSGPIKISGGGGYPTNVSVNYLDVAAAYDKNRDLFDDVADFGDCNGYGRWHKYIDQKTGKRSDAAHHYIYNQEYNKNLVVRDRCRVARVIFDGLRAVGVEFIQETPITNVSEGTTYDSEPTNGIGMQTIGVLRALASKLVVLSAGSFGSPALLERSGIGSPEILKSLDIPVLVDLPGVGENYNDHNVCFVPFYASNDADTMDDIFGGVVERIEPYLSEWLQTGQGLMAHNGIDVGVKLRPITKKDFNDLGPEFEDTWKSFYENASDKAVIWSGMVNGYLGSSEGEFATGVRKCISSCYVTYYPVSTGYVHITSIDPCAPPDFDPGYLNSPADIAILRWGYKHSRELIRRMKFYRGGVPSGHPKFPTGSVAAVNECAAPDPIDAEPIEYTKEDDLAIDSFHRDIVSTAWHALGTCAMKPRHQNGVVDSKLNVHGVENLKIVDLSIAPSNVGANTYNTALIVGEKAALIIAEELGIEMPV